MRRFGEYTAWLAGVLAIFGVSKGANVVASPLDTTNSVIAIANLDQQIAQLRDETGVEDLLLLRSRFLGDYDALERASALAEGRFATAGDLMRRARTRSALHRFADALADVGLAERAGAKADETFALRAAILVATGRAVEAIPQLEGNAARHPRFAARSALAAAYAAVGRLADADRLYVAALADLDTTSPFPYAWICFARGVMWDEQGGDPIRAETLYTQALSYLPEFVAANIHLAELELVRGDGPSAMARLDRVVQSSDEPEAFELLGILHMRSGDSVRGTREIALAQQRYESLLSHHPLAFADHAAEFYLGPGADPERAWALSQQNLANRETDRAVALAVKAAEAAGHYSEARALLQKHRSSLLKSVQLRIWRADGKSTP